MVELKTYYSGEQAMENLVTVEHLTYKYQQNDERPALSDVSLNIEKGSWTAIVGRNGSGKSTLARCIDGLLDFKQGVIKVGGIELTNDSVWQVRDQIGMIFQNPDNQFVGATVEDDVAFGMENKNIDTETMHKTVNQVLEQVRMTEFKTHQPDQLSGGQKQRVAIAGVLAVAPDLIILDESTSMLDPEGRVEILSLIKELHQQKGLTVISITHDVNEATLADHVIVLNNSVIAGEGTPESVFTNHKLMNLTGLEPPFTERLKWSLEAKGLNHFDHQLMSEKGMVDNLWQLRSKK